MQEKLRAPVFISSRLMAAVNVSDAEHTLTLHVARTGETDDIGRTQWRYVIDLPDGLEHEASDLYGPTSSRDALETLLSFLGASAESLQHEERTGRESENADLFPRHVMEWTSAMSDEIGMLAMDLEGLMEGDA